MKTKVGSFLSSDGHHRIHTICWLPKQKPVALLQINYGMAEYAERYEAVAQFFTQRGFLVACHDHLGHGQSIRGQQELGYFGQKGSTYLVEDSHLFTVQLKQEYPQLPLFLLGHSMGSLITEQYLKRYWFETSGAILMGCVYQPKILTAVLPEIRLRAKLRGKRQDPLLNAIAFGPYNLHFNHREVFSWLSSDPLSVARYREDPMLGFTFTTNGFLTLFELVQAQETGIWTQNLPLDFPILVTGGTKDAVGNFGKQLDKLMALFESKHLQNVVKKEWPNLRHELFFEVDTLAVEQAIYRWLMVQL